MNTHTRHFAATALLLAGALAHTASRADDFTVSGQISFHNDVVQVDFTVAAPGPVKIWTDSWQSGLNFDPTAALWVASGTDFALLAVVDDDDTVASGQGFYDAGFSLPALAAGSYRVTVAAAFNAPLGTLLSQGFEYGTQTPILLSEWNQPSYDPNANDQKGSFWRVNLANVDAAAAVPEPGQWLLLGLGLAMIGWRSNRC